MYKLVKVAEKLNKQRIDFLMDLKAGEGQFFLSQYTWWRLLAFLLCCVCPFSLLIFNAPAGPVFGLWVFLMILFGLHCVYGKDAEITDDGLTIYTFRRKKKLFSWKELKQTSRLQENRFELKNRDGETFVIKIGFVSNYAERSLLLLRDILNEFADRNGKKVDWEPQVRIPTWVVDDVWYEVVLNPGSKSSATLKLVLYAIFSIAISVHMYIEKEFLSYSVIPFSMMIVEIPALLRSRKLARSKDRVEFKFVGAQDVVIRINGLEYNVTWDETESVVPGTLFSDFYSKDPIPFDYGWSWTAPDGKEIIFDPRFIAPSDQTQSNPFRASVPANA